MTSGPAGGLLGQEPPQVGADLLFHDSPVGALFGAGGLQGAGDDSAGLNQELRVVAGRDKAAADDLRQTLALPGVLVDGDDGEHETVFGEMTAVANDQVLDHLVERTAVDAHAADGDALSLAGAAGIQLQRLARFEHKSLLQTGVPQVLGQLGMLGQLPVLAMDRQEVLGADQVQDQLQLFRAGVPGDVDGRVHRAVDHVGPAPREVIDHAIDRLLVAGNDARAENHGVARFHREVLMVVHGHPARGPTSALPACRRSPP